MNDHIPDPTKMINTGGSAFPCPPSQHSNGFYSTGEGMSLRDYFAAAALRGMLANGGSSWDEHDAKHAYLCADAMIRAREAK
jgi:hypothetical protein